MRLTLLLVLLLALPATGPAQPKDVGTVTGSVIVVEGKPLANQRDVWVYLERSPKPRSQKFGKQFQIIEQINEEFVPKVRVVPVGSTVGFPNRDRIAHNVFSPTPPSFDLGSYAGKDTKAREFTTKGEHEIYCDVHHKMNAKVKVVESEWFAEVKNGTFTISNVPPGTYKVVAWMPDSKDVYSEQITVTGGGSIALPAPLHLQKGKAPKRHLNKNYQPYPLYP
jgi:plastocyanin